MEGTFIVEDMWPFPPFILSVTMWSRLNWEVIIGLMYEWGFTLSFSCPSMTLCRTNSGVLLWYYPSARLSPCAAAVVFCPVQDTVRWSELCGIPFPLAVQLVQVRSEALQVNFSCPGEKVECGVRQQFLEVRKYRIYICRIPDRHYMECLYAFNRFPRHYIEGMI